MDARTRNRQHGIIELRHLTLPISVIGAGSIGSFTAFALAKMGCSNLRIFDPDKVAKHNVGCQLYGEANVGSLKVEVLKPLIEYHAGVEPVVYAHRWVSNKENPAEIIICAVDSMAVRREIWKSIKADHNVTHYIDARMGGELMRVFTVDMTLAAEITQYEKTLTVKPARIACSERSIVYNVFIIAGLITNQVKRIAKGQPLNTNITYDIPTYSLLLGHMISQTPIEIRGGGEQAHV
jgi:hypothetical protein